MKYVAYYRVSTQKQGQSGLGLEAQRTAVNSFVQARGEVIAEYTEIESGRRADRPQLALAMRHARRAKATLVIAKLDRLARNVKFLATLMEEKVLLAFCDMPDANEFTLHIMAAVAQHEAKAISQRTKDALAAAKARGVRLGGTVPLSAEARERGLETLRQRSRVEWERLRKPFEDAKKSGCVKVREFKAWLEENGVTTHTGNPLWSTSNVHSGMKRLLK